MRRGVQDNQALEEIETYQINSEVGIDVNARSEFNIKVRINVEVEWRSRQKSS
jgi:hypothetical protein